MGDGRVTKRGFILFYFTFSFVVFLPSPIMLINCKYIIFLNKIHAFFIRVFLSRAFSQRANAVFGWLQRSWRRMNDQLYCMNGSVNVARYGPLVS